ncbi:PfkB family carbohydrate kinase [Dictyobacter formicarum]|uniref:Ribokinase n=1 Tax=Dictyobacter formicarum TaxID=2778368 RepID=A0ABQ3VKZ3_9CHLR|nr:PfkB family carbohydrate kinase [Dictyobacter formicarum]GHO86572.1 ribokinase [Dictyobacter formicarum]
MSRQPDFLTLGHVTRDVQVDGSFVLGGTVTFAAQTAYHLGLAAAIVTCADAEVAQLLPTVLPEIALQVCPSPQTTTFANRYHEGFRTQYLYGRGVDITEADIPLDWRNSAGIVLFGPLTQELRPDMVTHFPRRPGTLLAATPQGWLRRWDADGRVWPTPWQEAEKILPSLDVLILSHDDLLPFASGNRSEADRLLAHWSTFVPLLVATDGRHGATLFQQGQPQRFPAYSAHEVDPTGAGDVFAAAFLTHLYRHRDPAQAVDFANCVAAFSIERTGISGIPTLSQVEQRRHIS